MSVGDMANSIVEDMGHFEATKAKMGRGSITE